MNDPTAADYAWADAQDAKKGLEKALDRITRLERMVFLLCEDPRRESPHAQVELFRLKQELTK